MKTGDGSDKNNSDKLRSDKLLTATVIIATYNRPQDLELAIDSVIRQTLPPEEIIIVDDGNLVDPPLRSRAMRAGIRYIYLRKPPGQRGLTRSRNLGVNHATSDLIFFLDDDVALFPDFMERSIAIYQALPQVSGMGGGEVLTKKNSPLAKLWFFYDVMFCMTGFKKGYFLPSCFSTNMGNPVLKTRLAPVEFLGGASFSFRRNVFQSYRFSEEFQGYGLGEDKDFSYRVSQNHILVSTPDARLHHYESPVMRYQKYQKAKAKVMSKYGFLTRCNVKKRFSGFWFCYAMAGYLLKRSLIMAVSFDTSEVQRVRGILAGFKEILALRKAGKDE